ncbi:N-formylglutamate amidohydrolase [Sphingomonas nostoxanthinifaciens]|uniref:N-formylglutamate amidohydrolase n=1 Tax=Sphingomonas nostoxanthinifaciens TaxID=2872652 RepID=UPI001CC20535|nr:N-formylglutamate amidohydrolase [Sphingomonas nostoxanthinifaciens]
MPGTLPVPVFERLGPAAAISPIVCAVPHAGRYYPPALLENAACPLGVLEELEDRHADLLVTDAVAHGAVAIVARVARAWIDLNRGEADIAPEMRDPRGGGGVASARARSGLGLIPTRIGRHELWHTPPRAADADTRIATVHAPYHAAIARALADAHDRFGFAILLDCHSMPPLRGARAARVVIGDLHGRSAAAPLARLLAATAEAAGTAAALNTPYAGAYSLARHGRPAANIHAVQIEIDRTLYLQSDLRTAGAGLGRVRVLIGALASCALSAIVPPALAAE